jgi:RecA/RadA recombinase
MAKKRKETGEVFKFADLQKELYKVSPDAELLGDDEFSNINEYFGFGNYLLNAQISGSLFRGAPAGRVTMLSGEHSSGKTYLSLNAVREAQAKGYYIIWIDTENAMDRLTMKKFGLDSSINKVDYHPIGTVEGVINLIVKLTSTLKDAKRDGLELPKILIVIDSLGNLSTEWEMQISKDGESGKVDMGHKQKLLKRLFRVCVVDCGILGIPIIATNHVYSTMSMYGEAVIV